MKIIYIDKNHPKSGIPLTNKLINAALPKHVELRRYYLIPVINNNISKLPDFPFSASMFLQCYYRLMNRKEHETLDNTSPLKTLELLLTFFNMYRHVRLDENFKVWGGFDGYFQAPLFLPED